MKSSNKESSLALIPTASLALPDQSSNHLDENLIQQAWRHVLDSENTAQSQLPERDQSSTIDTQQFSAKVALLAENPVSFEAHLIASIYKNKHRLKDIAKSLCEGNKSCRISYQKFFNKLVKELWFPHFARSITFSSSNLDEQKNFQRTAEKLVNELLDLFLIDDLKIDTVEGDDHVWSIIETRHQYGRYCIENSNKSFVKDSLHEAREFLNGGAGCGLEMVRFSNLWEYFNNVLLIRSKLFALKQTDKSFPISYQKRQNKFRKSFQNLNRSQYFDRYHELMNSAQVSIFQESYFQTAREFFPNQDINLASETEVDQFIHWVCNNYVNKINLGLTQPNEQIKPNDFGENLPDFTKLNRVHTQLKILATQNLFRTKILETASAESADAHILEKQFWINLLHEDVTSDPEFSNDTDTYLRKHWYHHFYSQQKIQSKYDQLITNPSVDELVTFIRYLYGLHQIAEVYQQSSNSSQQRQAKFYLEVIRLYSMQLEEVAFNLEATLKVPQFRPDDLSSATYTLQSLMNRQVLPQQLSTVEVIEDNAQKIARQRAEIGPAISGSEDFDVRLATAEDKLQD